MKINKPSVVTLTWLITDTLNEILSELEEPTEFFIGGIDLLPKIEDALLDHQTGDEIQLHLEPEHAFGEYDNQLVTFEAKSLFPDDIEENMCFESAAMPSGVSKNVLPNQLYTVTDIFPEHIIIDANHPLAGIAIRLEIKIISVRQADEIEIEQQSVVTNEFDPVIAVANTDAIQ